MRRRSSALNRRDAACHRHLMAQLLGSVGPAITTAVVTAVLTGVVTWLVQHSLGARLERLRQELTGNLAEKARRAEYVRCQLEKLYGPLAFFMEGNEHLTRLHVHINETYAAFFQGRGATDKDEASSIIAAANSYGELMLANNRDAVAVLRTNWAYIDQDDIEQAAEFITEVARHDVEFQESKRLPPAFYSVKDAPLRAPFLHRSPFARRIRDKLKAKQSEAGQVASKT